MTTRGKEQPAKPRADKTDFDGISQIIKQATGSQNDALAQLTATLETAWALNRGLTEQYAGALKQNRDLSQEIGDLQRRDLEREQWAAGLQAEARKAEVDARKTEMLLETARGFAKMLFLSAGAKGLPGGKAPEKSTGADETSEGNELDELVTAIGEVFTKLSPETVECLRAEAGDEAVGRVLRLIFKRQGVDPDATPEEKENA